MLGGEPLTQVQGPEFEGSRLKIRRDNRGGELQCVRRAKAVDPNDADGLLADIRDGRDLGPHGHCAPQAGHGSGQPVCLELSFAMQTRQR